MANEKTSIVRGQSSTKTNGDPKLKVAGCTNCNESGKAAGGECPVCNGCGNVAKESYDIEAGKAGHYDVSSPREDPDFHDPMEKDPDGDGHCNSCGEMLEHCECPCPHCGEIGKEECNWGDGECDHEGKAESAAARSFEDSAYGRRDESTKRKGRTMQESASTLIAAIQKGDAATIQTAFTEAITAKVKEHLENRKEVVVEIVNEGLQKA